MQVPPIHTAMLAVFLAALAALAVFDLRTRKLPNLWVGLLLGAGLVRAALEGGATGALSASAGAATGLVLLLWQLSKGVMGAGDVKYLAAVGAWTGPQQIFFIFLIASVLGGVLSVVALVRLDRAQRADVGRNLVTAAMLRGTHIPEPSQLSRARGIPFGVSISAAAAAVVLLGVPL